MNVEYVELVFENCESLKFKYPDICYLDINGIEDSYSSYSNAICLNKVASGFVIGINKNSKPDEHLFSVLRDPLSRIANDITQLCVHFTDKSNVLYLVRWPDGDDFYHSGQSIKRSNSGHIIISSHVDPEKANKDLHEDLIHLIDCIAS